MIVPILVIGLAAIFFLGATVASVSDDIARDNGLQTGVAGIDRLPIADTVASVFGSDATRAIGRAVTAIIWNETDPHGNTTAPIVGDKTIASGPSIGPMQVLRQTAIDLGLVSKDTTQADFAVLADDEQLCLTWGCEVFKSKLAAASGDMADALRRYNGSGSRAAQYRDAALSFLGTHFGDDWSQA